MAVAVMAGAFGAHGLRDRIDPGLMAIWEKAVLYHLLHALGLLVLAALAAHGFAGGRVLLWAAALLSAGIILFSGSLYLLVLTNIRWLGAITPIGGTAFIAAWLLLAVSLARG